MAVMEKDAKKQLLERVTIGRSISYSSYRQIPPSLAYLTPIPPAPDNPALATSWSPKGVLEDYRKSREKQEPDYVPADKFPGHVLEEASRSCTWCAVLNDRAYNGYNWESSKGGYWWETSYQDGSTRREFYWKPDNDRGYPDANKRYWLIVCHAPTKTEIEGFCFEPDIEKGFPLRHQPTYAESSSGQTYYYFITYTECGEIQKWEAKRDEQILFRRTQKEREIAIAKQKKIEEASRFRFAKPWQLAPEKSVQILFQIPDDYRCPLSLQIMFDPVLAGDGHTYEREEMEKWFKSNTTSPKTRQVLENKTLIPNFHARGIIDSFLTTYPEAWKDVYISPNLSNELFELLSGQQAIDVERCRNILQKDKRFLTLPIGEKHVLLLEFLCKQSKEVVQSYLPTIINMFSVREFKALATAYSVQDWIQFIAKICDAVSMPSVAEIFLKNLTRELAIEIDPVDMALYAIQREDISLFKLALSQMLDINQILEEGHTLLHIAAREGKGDFVDILLKKGANLKQRNNAGLKADAVAKAVGHHKIAEHIEFYKISFLLERVGIFSRIAELERENRELKSRLDEFEKKPEGQNGKNSIY